MFLTKRIQDQKNTPQIILKGKTAHLASYTFSQDILINIRTRQFHISISHQEHLLYRTLNTSYVRPVNIAKFLTTGFL